MAPQSIRLDGIYPPIPTPFNANGKVATHALTENLQTWNQYGLSGYVVLGSNGELVLLKAQESLRENDTPLCKRVSRRRLHSVMQDMIYLACRMVKHARQWKLSFGRHCLWFNTWRRVYLRVVAT